MFLTTSCVCCRRHGPVVCSECAEALVDAPVGSNAVFEYSGVAREIVLAMKHERGRGAVGWMAGRLGVLVERPVDVVTWAPTGSARRYDRGYDQAELLARSLGRQLRLPVRALLRRLPGPAQHGRGRSERLVGPSFVAPRPLSGTIVVVDDVITTGSTGAAAAMALRLAGASDIQLAAVARVVSQPRARLAHERPIHFAGPTSSPKGW